MKLEPQFSQKSQKQKKKVRFYLFNNLSPLKPTVIEYFPEAGKQNCEALRRKKKRK